jgi:starch synthase
MVTRLVDQKGLDILTDALEDMMTLDVQLVILGTGEEKYHRALLEAQERWPGQIRVLLQYDEVLAKRIYAGCDFFLMPSQYEPCGLSQLIALRYGTVPVVRKTGGLTDTVRNYNPRTGQGCGFVFKDYTADALIDSLKRALAVYRDSKKWKLLIRFCMEQDFSWGKSAREYEIVYRKAMKKK